MTFHIVFTSTNQEIFFDQSQFNFSGLFSTLFSVFLLYLYILRNPTVFDLSRVSVFEQKLS